MQSGIPGWICTNDLRLRKATRYLLRYGNMKKGPFPRYRALVFRLSAGCSAFELGRVGKWLPAVDSHHDIPGNNRMCFFDTIGEGSGTPVLHRVCPGPKPGGLLSSPCPGKCGLCGNCTRNLSTDNRMLCSLS